MDGLILVVGIFIFYWACYKAGQWSNRHLVETQGGLMGTAKETRARHEEELKNLQDNCSHEIISDWMPYMWAPGHYGADVKVCEHCEKTIETRCDEVVASAITTTSHTTGEYEVLGV